MFTAIYMILTPILMGFVFVFLSLLETENKPTHLIIRRKPKKEKGTGGKGFFVKI